MTTTTDVLTYEEKQQALAKGRVWEEMFIRLLEKKLPEHMKIIDTSATMIDKDCRSMPDIVVYDSKSHNVTYYDAKNKTFYWDNNLRSSLFTLDEHKAISYRSIAQETNKKVYITVWDSKKDPDHYYIMDILTPETDKFLYDNKYNPRKQLSLRWHKNLFKRIPLEREFEHEFYLA